MTNATTGPGFILQMGDGAVPENFSNVAEVKDIKGVGGKTDMHDATNQSSPNNTEEVLPGLLRTGEVAYDVQALPDDPTHDGVTGLQNVWKNRTLKNYRLIIPRTTKKWTFGGYITEFLDNFPVNGIATTALKIKPSGLPVKA
ncbi:MAG: hypothetical protein M3O87_08200 [Candidatus Dormibacteraeota bacterium]|nr:hypothetical protein [Candidatus Dormibacteraeota bacterium]